MVALDIPKAKCSVEIMTNILIHECYMVRLRYCIISNTPSVGIYKAHLEFAQVPRSKWK